MICGEGRTSGERAERVLRERLLMRLDASFSGVSQRDLAMVSNGHLMAFNKTGREEGGCVAESVCDTF